MARRSFVKSNSLLFREEGIIYSTVRNMHADKCCVEAGCEGGVSKSLGSFSSFSSAYVHVFQGTILPPLSFSISLDARSMLVIVPRGV